MDEFAALLERHKALVFKVANAYCSDAFEREDLVQEIAVQLWRSFPRYDAGRPFSTWAYRVALNVAISFNRRARRRPESVAPGDSVFEQLPAPPTASEDAGLLYRAVNVLNRLDRALVVLYLDGYNYADSAAILGISSTNAATRLNRLKARLRNEIANERIKENAR